MARKVLIGSLLTFFFLSCAYQPGRKYTSRFTTSDQCKVLAQKRAALAAVSHKAKKWKRKTTATALRTSPTEHDLLARSTDSYVQPLTQIPSPSAEQAKQSDLASPSVVQDKVVPIDSDKSEQIQAVTRPHERSGNDSVVGGSSLETTIAQYTYSLPFAVGLAALAGMAVLALGQEKSKQLSRWAAKNPWTARAWIAGAQISAGAAMVLSGHYLHEQGLIISDAVRYASLTGLTASTLLYPDVHAKMTWTQTTYLRQKFHDVSLFASGAALFLSVGNHYSITTQPHPESQHVYSVIDFTPARSAIQIIKNQPVLSWQQEPAKKKGNGDKVFYTILTCIGFTFLFAVVAALACEASCAGSGAGAVAIVLIGGVGLGFLLAAAIRKIWGVTKKKKQTDPVVQPN